MHFVLFWFLFFKNYKGQWKNNPTFLGLLGSIWLWYSVSIFCDDYCVVDVWLYSLCSAPFVILFVLEQSPPVLFMEKVKWNHRKQGI